jgi:predicted nucleic acid-binding protein
LTEVVVLDACVLVPIRLCGLLLGLAEAALYEPRWSERILDETERTLTGKLGLDPERAAKRIAAMREAFPEACVYGHEPLERDLGCDPKDRHVLAAAIAASATTIVTGNLKDFPDDACWPHGVDADHPDVFLSRLLAQSPDKCRMAVETEAARHRNPPETPAELLAGVTRIVPNFANAMYQTLLAGGR